MGGGDLSGQGEEELSDTASLLCTPVVHVTAQLVSGASVQRSLRCKILTNQRLSGGKVKSA